MFSLMTFPWPETYSSKMPMGWESEMVDPVSEPQPEKPKEDKPTVEERLSRIEKHLFSDPRAIEREQVG